MENDRMVRFTACKDQTECMNDDDIEVISGDHCDTINLKKDTDVARRPRKSILDDIKFFQDALVRKKFTRWIMVLGGVFVFLSGVLLIVTLNMSEDIDDKVRDSNALLRKQPSGQLKTDIPSVINPTNKTFH